LDAYGLGPADSWGSVLCFQQEEADAELAADLFGGMGLSRKKSDSVAGGGGASVGGAYASSVSSGGAAGSGVIKINTPKEMLRLAKQLGPLLKDEGKDTSMDILRTLLDRGAKDTLELDEVKALLTREYHQHHHC